MSVYTQIRRMTVVKHVQQLFAVNVYFSSFDRLEVSLTDKFQSTLNRLVSVCWCAMEARRNEFGKRVSILIIV